MPFNQKFQCNCLLLILLFAGAGCATAPARQVAETRPALILEDGACHEAIEAAMKTMIGSDHVRLSPEVFRRESTVLLSNYIPSELLGDKPNPFSEAADRRFLLHIHDGRCLLSLLDDERRLIATQKLRACECVPRP